MKALILHGGSRSDPALESVHADMCADRQANGWTVETIRLEDLKVGPCVGCFNCWLKTPGVCCQDDDGRTTTRAMIQSDALVLLTPVTFGGYASKLKFALDRFIPSISPFFERHGGEMHHKRRYPYTRDFYVIGWRTAPDAASAAIFARLVARNALNMRPPAWGSLVLDATQPADVRRAQMAALLSGRAVGKTPPATSASISQTPSSDPPQAAHTGGKRLLVINGSPRAQGASQKLAQYLAEGVAARGWMAEIQRIPPAVRDAGRWAALEGAFRVADAVAVCAPLYVDSIPAETILALERLAAGPAGHSPTHPKRMLALVQCGFAEAHQNDVALEIYAQFARQLGIAWSCGLAFGGGGMLGQTPLVPENRMVAPVVAALDQVVAAIAAEADIPASALAAARRPLIPRWLYFTMANLGMLTTALKQRAIWKLGAQPDKRVG